MEVEESSLKILWESIPEDVMCLIVQQMSETEYLKHRTRISFISRKCRENFLSWIQEEPLVKPFLQAIAESISLTDLNCWSNSEWTFNRLNKNTLLLGSFHQTYANILGMGVWEPELAHISLTHHFSPFLLKGYANSIYKEKHEFILENRTNLSRGDKIRYVLDLAELSSKTKEVDNAIAREVGPTTQLSYTYAYVKPERKKDRNLFIMTKCGKKKIYLSGLRSVYDNKIMRDGDKLYDISCKQRGNPSGKFEATSLLRGDAMISSLSKSLMHCKPVIARLCQLKSRLSKKSRRSKKLC